jgi:hypothetical protein
MGGHRSSHTIELEAHNFNLVTASFTLAVTDTFMPENTKSVGVRIVSGKLRVLEAPSPADPVLHMNCSELASLLFTAVDLIALHDLGAVRLEPHSPALLHNLAAAFRGQSPMTLSRF